MKCVANTLLLCLCIVVTSRAQTGIHITSEGDVGIGDETPYSRLTMSGSIGFHDGSFPLLYMYESEMNVLERALFVHSPTSEQVGLFYDGQAIGLRFGSPTDGVRLSGPSSSVRLRSLIFDEGLDETASIGDFCGIALRQDAENGRLNFLGACDTGIDSSNLIMSLARDGRIGIGVVPDSMYHFQVNGHMRAKEIVVETGWADYVFDPAYDLRPLHEVDAYIDVHRHLPGIPSATTVESEGLEIGDMSRRFMEKIEELTLYTIEQDKQIRQQQGQIEALIKLTTELKADLESIRSTADSQ